MQKLLKYRHLSIAVVALVLVNSCKNDGCNDPVAFNYDEDGTSEESCVYEPKQVSLNVVGAFGEEDLALDKEFSTSDGRAISFSYYGIYLSDLSFMEKGEDDAQTWTDQDVMLFKDDAKSIEAVYLNKSEITALSFDIGVDTAKYGEDPTTSEAIEEGSPLAIQVPSMYWGWAGGYRFISIEGSVDTSSTKDGSAMAPFAFHCGLPANLKTTTLSTQLGQTNATTIDVNLAVDFAVLLKDIDFMSTQLIIHDGTNPTTVKIMDNSVDAFEIR